MKDIAGKMVYITGGSSGIGLETAKLLASMGARIVVFARDRKKLERAGKIIEKTATNGNRNITTAVMDVKHEKEVLRVMGGTVRRLGPPDILINSAGLGHSDYFENIDYRTFDDIMKINLYGTWNVTAAALPYMKHKGGHIVILSSEAGLMGVFGYTAYGTSKYALVGFAECLRMEVKRYGIGVTVVCPPEVDTPLVVHEARTIPPEARAVKNVAGRLAPDAVARAIVGAIRKNRFLVVPGFLARMLYHSHRLSNGTLSRITTDLIVARAAGKTGKK